MNAWQFIFNKTANAVPVVLLCVLQSEGSSPGRQGFKMAVAADGDLFGTIGGGIMEHKFVEMAKVKLKESRIAAELIRQVHDKRAAKNQSGMICSGEQTIFLYLVTAKDHAHISDLAQSLEKNRNGTLRLSMSGIEFSPVIPPVNYLFEQYENDFIYQEKTGYRNELYILGGGHCSLAFSKLMRGMDFYIRVFEERHGLNTMADNVYAHEKTILPSWSMLKDLVGAGDNVYVVIMTFGYRSDDEALRALLGKKFKYLGMLGSKKKIEKLFSEYRSENLDEKYLETIHSPIGIQVKSQTVEEIAISIAAEIIAVKNKDQ